MTISEQGRRRLTMLRLSLMLALAGVMLGACSTEELKKTMSSMSASDSKSEPSTDASANSRPKEITELGSASSMVIGKYCPRIVEPYRVTDNLLSVGQLTAQLGLANGVASLAPGTAGAPARPVSLGVTAKMAAKQLNWLPMNMERAYGESLHADKALEVLPRNKKSEKAYQAADKILADVNASIGEPHDYTFKIFILKEAGTAAMSYPGGYIYIASGLTSPKMKSRAYFAVAHEVAHILQRHETKELQGQLIDSVSTGADLLKMVQGNTTPAQVLTLLSSTKNLFAKHFIDQELAADACATKMMVKIFPKPQEVRKALLEFENSLDKPEPEVPLKAPANDLEKYTVSLHVLVSSPMRRHPNSVARRKNIDEMYAQIVTSPPSRAAGAQEGGARKS